jgi:hypothetical protein
MELLSRRSLRLYHLENKERARRLEELGYATIEKVLDNNLGGYKVEITDKGRAYLEQEQALEALAK